MLIRADILNFLHVADFALDLDVPCHGLDPDLWFDERPAVLERAKAACRGCPVRAACLADALCRREPWGVWGGEILLDGNVVARKRGRGRPPRADQRPTTRSAGSRPVTSCSAR